MRRARAAEPLSDWCEARLSVCEGRATDRHHLAGRLDGFDELDELLAGRELERADDRTLDLCHACHRWAHANPAKAYELGLLERRLTLEESSRATVAEGLALDELEPPADDLDELLRLVAYATEETP